VEAAASRDARGSLRRLVGEGRRRWQRLWRRRVVRASVDAAAASGVNAGGNGRFVVSTAYGKKIFDRGADMEA